MEYSWAFAAARTTFPELYQPSSAQKRLNRPTRSNSTSGAQTKKRPLIPGHSRASSCSSTNHSSNEGSSQQTHHHQHHQQQEPQQPQPPPPHQHPQQHRHQHYQQHHHHSAAGALGGGATGYALATPASVSTPVVASSLPSGSISSSPVDEQNPHLHRPPSPNSSSREHHQSTATSRLGARARARNIRSFASSAIAIPSSNTPHPRSEPESAAPARASSVGLLSRSPRSPRPPSVTFSHTPSSLGAIAAHSQTYLDRRMLQHATMLTDPPTLTKFSGGITTFPRTESVSSASGATTLSSRTVMSSEPPPWASDPSLPNQPKPMIIRNGRTYLSDPSLLYPLPVDLAELHRQTLRMLLLFQLFGGPVCSPALADKPPTRVLEIGCGSGFWSMMCHRYYSRRGHADISFTGMDIAPIAPGAGGHRGSTAAPDGQPKPSSSFTDSLPDKDMKWRFVQHDMRRLPWPFPDGEFDLIMVKDMSLATPLGLQQSFMDEYIRVLRPGGTLEVWESDHTLRMLRPHVPEGRPAQKAGKKAGGPHNDGGDLSESEDENEAANKLGAYVMNGNTPLSAPLNNFLVEYNTWISRALEARGLSAVPCTLVGPNLIQEAESLTGIGSRRLAVPLSEVRWEREGVGGVVTKDGKSYIETKSKARAPALAKTGGTDDTANRPLTTAQTAMRRTALMGIVQQIQSLEGVLREANGKSQDEWDAWLGKMTNDLVRENGSSWGECLEIGAWWARKKP